MIEASHLRARHEAMKADVGNVLCLGFQGIHGGLPAICVADNIKLNVRASLGDIKQDIKALLSGETTYPEDPLGGLICLILKPVGRVGEI